MKTKLLAFGLFLATAGAIAAYPALQSLKLDPVVVTPPPVQNQKPKIEVVFVLDTTGSMGGLIHAAKENIWSIATTMASAKPTPELKMGLVAFRDRGDAYVTRVTDLSTDLDQIYVTLMDYQAEGGGDGPESVNQALHDAVHRLSWSQDDDSYRVIFLVGDAPPHMDYPGEVQYPAILKQATAKGIVINTIQAGQNSHTAQTWKHIASLNQGEYVQVGQSGNAVAVATPYDDKIAKLSRELDETRLFYGDAEDRAEAARKKAATDKLAAASSPAAQAKRGAFNTSGAGGKNFLGDKELVDDVASGRVDLDAVPETELPEPLRALPAEERQKLVEQTAAKRDALRREIRALNEKRQTHIREELAETGAAEEESLDHRIFGAVKAQAEEKGFSYGAAAPSY